MQLREPVVEARPGAKQLQQSRAILRRRQEVGQGIPRRTALDERQRLVGHGSAVLERDLEGLQP